MTEWLKRLWRLVRAEIFVSYLACCNTFSRSAIDGGERGIVSITTYGSRFNRVHLTIESVARGKVKPRSIVLWLDDPELLTRIGPKLQRQIDRGLEVELCDRLGPHCKYYPHVERTDVHSEPLITADDDVLYPRSWLSSLLNAYRADPMNIHAWRARKMLSDSGRLEPYESWPLSRSAAPSHSNLPTGVSGTLYPPNFLQSLKRYGTAFRSRSLSNDDIWVKWVALRTDTKVAQVSARPREFLTIPWSQDGALMHENVTQNGNDLITQRLFDEDDIALIEAAED